MSSTSSTIVIKSPNSNFNYHGSRYEDFGNYSVAVVFWVCCSILNATMIEISSGVQGVLIYIRLEETVLSLISIACLLYGARIKNYYWAIMWTVLTAWYMYDLQYNYLVKMFTTLNLARRVPVLAWVALFLHCSGLVLKALIVIRMAKLILNQWNYRRIEAEMNKRNQF